MKFIDSLKAIKADVINELFNIKKLDINLNKIENGNYTNIINKLKSNNIITKSADLYKTDFLLADLNFLSIKEKDEILDIISKMKTGNYYLQLNEDKLKLDFEFMVIDKLYRLYFLQRQSKLYEIVFGEANRRLEWIKNSLFKISGAKDQLFNKIKSITKNEITNWKTSVFMFRPATEDEAKISIPVQDTYIFISDFQRNLNTYLMSDENNENNKGINYMQKLLSKFDYKTKIFIKSYLRDKLEKINNNDADLYYKSIFENEKLKENKTIISKPYNQIFNRKEITELIMKKSVRYKIYKEAIKAILGDKVKIEQDYLDTFFSLSSFSLSTMKIKKSLFNK